MPEQRTPPPTAIERPHTGRLDALDSARLMRCRVVIAGLGNIGALLALLLARLRVGMIRLIDRDRLEPKNFRNQCYGQPADVGRLKTDVIAEQIHLLHPDITVDAIATDLADVPLGKFADANLCLSCLDSLYARQLQISERAYVQGIPAIDGGVDAGGDWLGKVQCFVPGGACLECGWTAGHYRQAALETPCVPDGDPTGPPTLAPALMGTAVASVMAAEAVKLLLGHTPPSSFELAFDLASRRWLESRLRPNAQCRFDHRVIDDVCVLPVPLAKATVGDLLSTVGEQFGDAPVQMHFRRRLHDSGLFGPNRFPSEGTLQSLSGRRLAEIGLTADDRIRIDGCGRSLFIALGEDVPAAKNAHAQRSRS